MGIIRKTLSVSTLGFVNFRSKSELVKRAENARDDAESRNQDLHKDVQRTARNARRANRRAHKAEIKLLAADKKRTWRKGRRALGQLPSDGSAVVADASRSAKRKAKRLARRAGKAARKA